MKVNVFIPCYINQLEPNIGIQMIKILENLGCEISINSKSYCCGQPAFNAGFKKEAQQVCSKFFEGINNDNYTIIPSASCAGFLKNYTSILFNNNEHQNTNNKLFEFTDFITKFFNYNASNISFPHKVAYHTSCASLREYKTTEQTFNILKQIKDLEIIDFKFSDECCGFGGTFAEKFSPISISMAKRKLEILQQSGAEVVISNDYSCLFQLKSVATKLNLSLKFLHLIEILN